MRQFFFHSAIVIFAVGALADARGDWLWAPTPFSGDIRFSLEGNTHPVKKTDGSVLRAGSSPVLTMPGKSTLGSSAVSSALKLNRVQTTSGLSKEVASSTMVGS